MSHSSSILRGLGLALLLLAGCADAGTAPAGAPVDEPAAEAGALLGAGISLPARAAGPSPSIGLSPALAASTADGDSRTADSTFTNASFTGYGDRQLLSNQAVYGARFTGWRTLVDAEQGGSGNFANEPTAPAVAFWVCEEEDAQGRLCTEDRERRIEFSRPVARVSFSYSARPAQTELTPCPYPRSQLHRCRVDLYDKVIMEAWDTIVSPGGAVQHVLLGSTEAPINNPLSWSAGALPGDPGDAGDFRVWSPIEVATDDNRIDYVVFRAYPNFVGIDNFRFVQVNHEPVAELSAPEQAHEGVPLTISGAVSYDRLWANGSRHPQRDAVVAYRWSFGDGSASRTTAVPEVSHTYADDGSYRVTLEVADPNGAWSTEVAQATVIVQNQAPVVDLGEPATISLPPDALRLTRQGSFTDPGAEGSWSATVDYGDGAGPRPLALTPHKTFQLDHTYARGGGYTVRVVVDDGDAQGAATLAVRAANTAPVPAALADAALDEGGTFSATLGFADPDADSWTATVDYGDGTPPATLSLSGRSVPLSHLYRDQGSFPLVVRVHDGTATATATATITGRSVAPTATLAADPATQVEGLPIRLAFSQAADPSPTDREAGFQYAFDCGAGYGTYGGAAEAACVAGPVGERTLRGRIRDKDGAAREYVVAVQVLPANRPPTVSALADLTVQCTTPLGARVQLDGSASDPDGDALSIAWLRGARTLATTLRAEVTLGIGAHELTLRATDPEGASASDEARVTVADTEAPAVQLAATPGSLWPPNHRYHTVAVSARAADACSGAGGVEWVVGHVESNEADEAPGAGDGNTTGDVRVTPAGGGAPRLSSNAQPRVEFRPGDQLEVRAERYGTAAPRVYTITLQARDAAGNLSPVATATVVVEHDRSGPARQ